MTKFSNKFKKPCFWPIFPIFGAKKIFLENPALSHTTSYGFLAPYQNLEKVNDTIQKKCPDRWKDGRMYGRTDRQTLFYRTLLATAGGPVTGFYMKHNAGRKWVNLRENISSYIISPSSRWYKIKKIIWAQNFSHNFIVAQKRIGKPLEYVCSVQIHCKSLVKNG